MKTDKFIPAILALASGLAACSSGSPRYQDVDDLAHPPKVQTEQAVSVAAEENGDEPAVSGDKQPLGDKVYLVDDKAATLRVKLPFKKAWYAVRLALQQLEADIIRFDSDEGVYVVNYKPESRKSAQGGLQGLLGGLLSSQPETSRYQIQVKKQALETEVTVAEAKGRKQEKYIYNVDGYEESEPTAEPQVLFEHLFETLRDDVVMKSADK